MTIHMDDTDRSFLEDLLPWLPKLPEYIRKQKDRGQRSFKSQGTWVGAFTVILIDKKIIICYYLVKSECENNCENPYKRYYNS